MRFLVTICFLLSLDCLAFTVDNVTAFCESYAETKTSLMSDKSYPLEPACKRYVIDRQCHNRKVCKTVCSAVGGAVGGAGGAVGGAVCSEVCEYIPDCVNLHKCVEYH